MALRNSKRSVVAFIALVCGSGVASAAIIDGANWADETVNYTSNIQNYNGTLMGPTTTWWLTGPADCDVDGNGYAWDAEDHDTVGGWRSAAPSESVTLYWETGIPDLSGPDLTIHLYSGPSAAADVFASVDGNLFEQIGTLGAGTPGYLLAETFDFAGAFAADVQYVRVARTASGPQTGMFFDAFEGQVPEPTSLLLLSVAALGLRRRHA